MKSYRVVRSLSLAAGVGLVACSASNGDLFEEDPELGVEASEPSEPPPRDVPPAPASVDERPSSTDEAAAPGTEAPDEDLPLSGDFPTPPTDGTPGAPATPEQPAPDEREGPVVVSVSPADGAVGVHNGQNIVIVFSTPMNREATEAAYQSESVPSSSVSFVWNDAGTELTIVPDAPLAYPTGSDPEQVPTRRVSFFISASATDLEGHGLPAPFESSFSLLRRVDLTLFALQDRDLSGSFRSNDTYGTGACARAQINMCVGDVRVNGSNAQYKGFISFELEPLPEAAQSVEAQLTLEITGTAGNPFGGLGALVLEHAAFDEIGAEAFSADALDEMGLIADDGGAGTIVSADVAPAFMADRRERSMTQYRLRFEDATDGDNNSDAIVSAWDTQTLEVSYLIP